MGIKSDIEVQIDRGINLKWSSAPEIEKYVTTLTQLVSQFESNSRLSSDALVRLERHIEGLRSCAFTPATLKAEIDAINNITSTLTFGYLKDLKAFLAKLNDEIESILLKRLTDALQAFSSRIENPSADGMISPFSFLSETSHLTF